MRRPSKSWVSVPTAACCTLAVPCPQRHGAGRWLEHGLNGELSCQLPSPRQHCDAPVCLQQQHPAAWLSAHIQQSAPAVNMPFLPVPCPGGGHGLVPEGLPQRVEVQVRPCACVHAHVLVLVHAHVHMHMSMQVTGRGSHASHPGLNLSAMAAQCQTVHAVHPYAREEKHSEATCCRACCPAACRYLHWVACPSELPPTLAAYKTQQYRWNSGPMVVIKSLIRRIWTTDRVGFIDRLSCTYFFLR